MNARKVQDIGEVFRWYGFQHRLIVKEQLAVLTAIASGTPLAEWPFGTAESEIRSFFASQIEELDMLVMLGLFTSAEGKLRLDFSNRVTKRLKDGVSKKFRRVSKSRGQKIRLDEDILETWSEQYPQISEAVGDFRGTKKLRDWLAHGRYWHPKLGRTYSPSIVYEIANNLLEEVFAY